MANITFEPVKALIGAIAHVNRAELLSDEVAQATLATLEERGVVVFPGLNLTDEEQLALTDKLGDRVNFSKSAPGADATAQDVYKITLDPEINSHAEYVLGTFFWHVDGATIDQPLPKATLLSARTLSQSGGQTEFANLYAAWKYLPERDQAVFANLRVLHTLRSSMRDVVDVIDEDSVVLLNKAADMDHPLVWTHHSGRQSLLLGSHADKVIGMGLAQGRALIRRLTEWAAQPDFTYSHEWQPGDFVIWDNCGVMHRVVPYDDPRRTMHRTTLAGLEKVA